MKYRKVAFLMIGISFHIPSKAQIPVCNEDNFEDYIYNRKKTEKLIETTGSGCDLTGINLRMLILQKQISLMQSSTERILKMQSLERPTFL